MAIYNCEYCHAEIASLQGHATENWYTPSANPIAVGSIPQRAVSQTVTRFNCGRMQRIGNPFYLYSTMTGTWLRAPDLKFNVMRHFLLMLLLCSVLSSSFGQTPPLSKKEANKEAKEAKEAEKEASRVPISNTGCTVDVFCFPGRFDAYELEDGSTVYADDCEKEGVTYGIYCVKLIKPVTSLDQAEDTVASYLDFVKLDYGIVKSKGYDKGHKLDKDESTRGLYDSWEDVDKHKWKVKAWTNGKFICILYMHSASELPDKKAEVFLEGVRFPGMKK